jgi:TorA-specific chaperone
MSDPGSTPTRSEALAPSDLALCRAVLYDAVSLALRPPSEETSRRLLEPGAARVLTDAAAVLDAAAPAGLAEPAAALARPEADLDELRSSHQRLFGHTARGAVSPYETEYGEEVLFQQPQELGDLAGFLRAFGLELRADAHERLDHVSCECEFLAFLAAKEAWALEAGDAEMRAATASASHLFLRDHLGRFAPAFSRLLARADAGGFFGAAADLLAALVRWDAHRLGVPIGSERLGLRPDPSTIDIPAGCDSCPAGEAR